MDTTVDLKLIKRERVSRMFHFSTPQVLTESQAVEAQKELSYHPAGYGFYSFKSTPTGTTWACGDSCD